MSSKTDKKASEMVLEVLKNRSKKSIELARNTMLADKVPSKVIDRALKYYVSSWELFTFPGLFSIACEAVGADPDEAVETQAAIVMLTAALDIHDDIIDRSSAKHGKLTVLGKFGHDVSLLLGNAFFVEGFTLLGKSLVGLPVGKAREVFEGVKKLMFEVGTAHALELDFRGKMDVKPEDYMPALKMKAASAEISMQLGAIMGNGTDAEVEALTGYGRILGMLATLRDEFIDVFEAEELLRRVRNEVLPIPVLYALQGKNSKQIQTILMKRKVTDEDASLLLDMVLESKEVERLRNKMESLVNDACNLSSQTRTREAKDILNRLAESSLEDLQ